MEALDRKASRFSLLEKIAAFSVVAGIICEDWDDFGKFIAQPSWEIGRAAIGGFVVAIGIVFEIWFSSRSASAERKIRDWYAMRVAELNLETERLRKENSDTAVLLGYRSVGDMKAFEDAMRVYRGTPYAIEFSDSNEAGYLQWELHGALKNAGWTAVADPRGSILHASYGVWIETVGDREGFPRSTAGDALAEWLDGQEIATIACVVERHELGLGTVVIGIGPRPETIGQYSQIRAEYRRRRSKA